MTKTKTTTNKTQRQSPVSTGTCFTSPVLTIGQERTGEKCQKQQLKKWCQKCSSRPEHKTTSLLTLKIIPSIKFFLVYAPSPTPRLFENSTLHPVQELVGSVRLELKKWCQTCSSGVKSNKKKAISLLTLKIISSLKCFPASWSMHPRPPPNCLKTQPYMQCKS